MHAISSYHGNRPTNKHTHKHTYKPTDRTDYNTLCRSFTSMQCNNVAETGETQKVLRSTCLWLWIKLVLQQSNYWGWAVQWHRHILSDITARQDTSRQRVCLGRARQLVRLEWIRMETSINIRQCVIRMTCSWRNQICVCYDHHHCKSTISKWLKEANYIYSKNRSSFNNNILLLHCIFSVRNHYKNIRQTIFLSIVGIYEKCANFGKM